MHSGPFVILRLWLLYARPRTQVFICLGMVAGGLALVVALGQPAGLLPLVFGVAFAVGALRARSRGRQPTSNLNP